MRGGVNTGIRRGGTEGRSGGEIEEGGEGKG